MFELWRHFRTKISILWLGDVAVQCSYRISSWLKPLAWPAPRFEPVRVRFWPSLAGITTAFTCWWSVIGVTQWDLVGSKTLVKNIMAKGATYTKVREEEGFLHRLLLDLPWSKRTGDCLKKTTQHIMTTSDCIHDYLLGWNHFLHTPLQYLPWYCWSCPQLTGNSAKAAVRSHSESHCGTNSCYTFLLLHVILFYSFIRFCTPARYIEMCVLTSRLCVWTFRALVWTGRDNNKKRKTKKRSPQE